MHLNVSFTLLLVSTSIIWNMSTSFFLLMTANLSCQVVIWNTFLWNVGMCTWKWKLSIQCDLLDLWGNEKVALGATKFFEIFPSGDNYDFSETFFGSNLPSWKEVLCNKLSVSWNSTKKISFSHFIMNLHFLMIQFIKIYNFRRSLAWLLRWDFSNKIECKKQHSKHLIMTYSKP